MKIAIVGSRGCRIENLRDYIPENVTEIVSGGADGIDKCAAKYAVSNGLKLTEFLPEYNRYKRGAPIVRNKQIAEYADFIIAFWNGRSKGTQYIINYCQKVGKPCRVVLI